MKDTLVLSAASFREAARKVREHREEIQAKCEELCTALIGEGYVVTHSILESHIDTGKTIGSIEIIQSKESGKVSASLQVTSDAILFLEFGSGLIGQGTAPHAGEFGMGSGTYPGKGHWDDTDVWVHYGNGLSVHHDQGWVYYGDDGKKHFTEGMVASLPMLTAVQTMKRKMQVIAERVFKW